MSDGGSMGVGGRGGMGGHGRLGGEIKKSQKKKLFDIF